MEKKGGLRNLEKFTVKQLYPSLFFEKVTGLCTLKEMIQS